MEPWKQVASSPPQNATLTSTLTKTAYQVYHYLFVWPLSHLYFFGPAIQGYGFWQGRGAASICAQLTPSNEEFWKQQPAECQRIIDTHFYSFIVPLEIGCYFYLWYCVGKFLKRRYL